jgi:hypothetical protein
MDILPALAQGRLCLALIHPSIGHTWLMQPLAVLARRGPLKVIDAGNHFNAYRLARALRAQGVDPTPILQRIYVSRSFTCHQLAASLGHVTLQPCPLVVLDFLATFQDENVSIYERRRLFTTCLTRLKQIAASSPVLLTAKTNHAEFIASLLHSANQVFQTEVPALPLSLPLF